MPFPRPITPRVDPGRTYSGFNTYGMFSGTQMPIFNAISTRNGGEVISSDQY